MGFGDGRLCGESWKRRKGIVFDSLEMLELQGKTRKCKEQSIWVWMAVMAVTALSLIVVSMFLFRLMLLFGSEEGV